MLVQRWTEVCRPGSRRCQSRQRRANHRHLAWQGVLTDTCAIFVSERTNKRQHHQCPASSGCLQRARDDGAHGCPRPAAPPRRRAGSIAIRCSSRRCSMALRRLWFGRSCSLASSSFVHTKVSLNQSGRQGGCRSGRPGRRLDQPFAPG
jgi:hypothetical protein